MSRRQSKIFFLERLDMNRKTIDIKIERHFQHKTFTFQTTSFFLTSASEKYIESKKFFLVENLDCSPKRSFINSRKTLNLRKIFSSSRKDGHQIYVVGCGKLYVSCDEYPLFAQSRLSFSVFLYFLISKF